MFKTISGIDLERLKMNHVRLYYFGLGFIQLKIDETWRLHFYSKELPAITEDVHNHRYDFQSTILAGSITNHSYQVNEGDSHIMVNESCNPEIEAPALDKPCSMLLNHSKTMVVGWSYYMQHDEFHRVEADDCITLLRRSDYKKEFAQIILPVGKAPVCPFSQKIPKSKLWRIMADMLKRHRA